MSIRLSPIDTSLLRVDVVTTPASASSLWRIAYGLYRRVLGTLRTDTLGLRGESRARDGWRELRPVFAERAGDEEREKPELSLEELESEAAGLLPDRHAMSLIDASVTIPAIPALAAECSPIPSGSLLPSRSRATRAWMARANTSLLPSPPGSRF